MRTCCNCMCACMVMFLFAMATTVLLYAPAEALPNQH